MAKKNVTGTRADTARLALLGSATHPETQGAANEALASHLGPELHVVMGIDDVPETWLSFCRLCMEEIT